MDAVLRRGLHVGVERAEHAFVDRARVQHRARPRRPDPRAHEVDAATLHLGEVRVPEVRIRLEQELAIDVRRHIGGADDRHDLAIRVDPVARNGQWRALRQERVISDPETGGRRRRMPRDTADRDLNVIQPRRQVHASGDGCERRPQLGRTVQRHLAFPDRRSRVGEHPKMCGRRWRLAPRVARAELTTIRRRGVSPRSIDASTGRASIWDEPSSTVATASCMNGASSAASDGARTQRPPAPSPRMRSTTRSGHARGVPSRSTRWTSGTNDRVALPFRSAFVGKILEGGQPQRQRERTRRNRRQRGPHRAARGGNADRAVEIGGCDGIRGADQEFVRERRLARPGDERRGALRTWRPRPHRHVEWRTAEDHEAAPLPHELAQRGPGLHRERAAIGQNQGVGRLAGQAVAQRRGRIEPDDSEPGQSGVEDGLWNGRRVDGRKSRRGEQGDARGGGRCALRRTGGRAMSGHGNTRRKGRRDGQYPQAPAIRLTSSWRPRCGTTRRCGAVLPRTTRLAHSRAGASPC